MSSTSDLISELVRAANLVEKLDEFEKRLLLERAVTTVRDMRFQIGIPPGATPSDALIPIRITATTVARRSNDDVRAALLNAADMVRTLKIVLDAKDEVSKDQ